jgi:hypothetical protein
MAERPRMTAADLVDKLLASEHADVLRDSVAWLVAEQAQRARPPTAPKHAGLPTF